MQLEGVQGEWSAQAFGLRGARGAIDWRPLGG